MVNDCRVNIDTATGLPELPEGFYWKIKALYKGSDYLEVAIFRRSTSFWRSDNSVEYGVVRKEEASPESISRFAQYAFRRFQEYDFENDWKKYVGDYPPKKLEA